MVATRLDNDTVLTDDGTRIFLPLTGRVAAQADPIDDETPGLGGTLKPGMPAPPGQPDQMALPSMRPGAPAAVPGPTPDPLVQGPPPALSPSGVPYLPGTELNEPNAQIPAPPPPGPLDGTAPPPLPTQRGQTVSPPVPLGRPGADLVDYASKGAPVKTDADYTKLLGTVGQEEESAKIAQVNLDDFNRRATAEEHRIMAAETLKVADEYAQKTDEIETARKARWDAWNKHMDETSKAVVDPHRAFNNMSSHTKAMWMLAFVAGGVGGSLPTIQAGLDKLVSDDIAAQKFGITNRMDGLKEQENALKEMDKGDTSAMERWYFQRNLRYESLGKSLDARIAEMGAPAAKAAGLLGAKAMIDKEIATGLKNVWDANTARAVAAQKQANEQANIRLTAALRDTSEKIAAGRTAKAAEAAENAKTSIPTRSIGVGVLENKGGKWVPAPQDTMIRARTPEDARAVTKLVTGASAEAAGLNYVRKRLSTMSGADFLRGGDPEFKSAVTNLYVGKVHEASGLAYTKSEIAAAARREFGIDLEGRPNIAEAALGVGPAKEGAINAIDANLRNLSENTMKQARGYLRGDDAENFKLDFTPQDQRTEAPGEGDLSQDAAISNLSGGTVTPDSGKRAPYTANQARAAEAIGPLSAATYESDKAEGKLPTLSIKDETAVNDASAAFSKLPSNQVIERMTAALKKPGLSPEAQFEIRMEGLITAAQARAKEQDSVKLRRLETEDTFHPPDYYRKAPDAKELADLYNDPAFQQDLKEAGLIKAPQHSTGK